jgi:3-phenylpropionate/trans-cinnamate dioxygenase ferredoxin reductase subunit
VSSPERIVIVGAGQAGFQSAASLRELGFGGSIVFVGDECEPPYQRPPLSKGFLKDGADPDTLSFRASSFYGDRRIELLTGRRAAAIDRLKQSVVMESGEQLRYDHLILAVGARNRPIRVPGSERIGVHQLRTIEHAVHLRRDLGRASRVVVIGAGFIGLEFAAVAAERGVDITVIETANRPMARAVSVEASRFFHADHARRGVRFAFDSEVVAIHGPDDRVGEVETADGRRFAADLVVVGIGVIPNSELAAAAGLAVANGIVVDDRLATSDPAISAIGDCASHPSDFADCAVVRIESVQNAVDQARAVAARLVGRPRRYDSVPWFWSDQGPHKLQIAGLAVSHDMTVSLGNPEASAFSVLCFRADRLVAVESVNRPADHMAARKLLASGARPSVGEATAPGFDLKAYLRSGGQI